MGIKADVGPTWVRFNTDNFLTEAGMHLNCLGYYFCNNLSLYTFLGNKIALLQFVIIFRNFSRKQRNFILSWHALEVL